MTGIPVGRKPVQARAIARVESILTEAGSIIAAEGIKGLTMTKVAKASGIAIGSLYQYFPTEASLVAALAERHLGEGHERLLRDIAAATSAADMPTAMQRALKTYLHITEDRLSAALCGRWTARTPPVTPGRSGRRWACRPIRSRCGWDW
jgi:AcrR family transcriptional regulator